MIWRRGLRRNLAETTPAPLASMRGNERIHPQFLRSARPRNALGEPAEQNQFRRKTAQAVFVNRFCGHENCRANCLAPPTRTGAEFKGTPVRHIFGETAWNRRDGAEAAHLVRACKGTTTRCRLAGGTGTSSHLIRSISAGPEPNETEEQTSNPQGSEAGIENDAVNVKPMPFFDARFGSLACGLDPLGLFRHIA